MRLGAKTLCPSIQNRWYNGCSSPKGMVEWLLGSDPFLDPEPWESHKGRNMGNEWHIVTTLILSPFSQLRLILMDDPSKSSDWHPGGSIIVQCTAERKLEISIPKDLMKKNASVNLCQNFKSNFNQSNGGPPTSHPRHKSGSHPGVSVWFSPFLRQLFGWVFFHCFCRCLSWIYGSRR